MRILGPREGRRAGKILAYCVNTNSYGVNTQPHILFAKYFVYLRWLQYCNGSAYVKSHRIGMTCRQLVAPPHLIFAPPATYCIHTSARTRQFSMRLDALVDPVNGRALHVSFELLHRSRELRLMSSYCLILLRAAATSASAASTPTSTAITASNPPSGGRQDVHTCIATCNTPQLQPDAYSI